MTSAPRSVLVAHPFPDLYGADLMLVRALRTLMDAGATVDVRVPEPGPLLEVFDAEGIGYHVEPFPVLRKAALRPVPFALMALRSPFTIARLARELRRRRPDVLYVNTLTLPHWLFAARLARIPCICHVREAEQGIARPLQRGLALPLLAADVVIANSMATANWLIGNLRLLRRRVRVVYNGFDLPDATPLPARRGPLRIALVGRLNPRKGGDVAIDAVELMTMEGCDVELDIVGDVFRGWEWYADELRERARARGVADRVHMRGFTSDPRAAYEAADIVIVPSRVEPFGNVAVEALGAGRPVVATRAGGLSEILEHEVTGLLVAPGSARELADAVRRLADDPQLAARLATAGAASVRERFGLEQFGAALRAAIDAAAA